MVPGILGTLYSFSQFLWGFGGLLVFWFGACLFFGVGWLVFLMEGVFRSLVLSGAKMVLVVHFRRDGIFFGGGGFWVLFCVFCI